MPLSAFHCTPFAGLHARGPRPGRRFALSSRPLGTCHPRHHQTCWHMRPNRMGRMAYPDGFFPSNASPANPRTYPRGYQINVHGSVPLRISPVGIRRHSPCVKCALRATSHAGQFRDLNPAEMSPSPLACEALFANRGGICSPSFSKRRFTRSLRPPTSFWHG